MQHKRLVLVSMTPFLGGSEIGCTHLVRLLQDDLKVKAIVHSPELYNRLHGLTETSLVPECDSGSNGLKYAKAAKMIIRDVNQNGPGIIILNGQGEANLAPLVSALRLPQVIIRHTALELELSSFKRALYRGNARLAQRVVSVAKHVYESHKQFIPAHRNVLIQNWITNADVNTPRYNSAKFLRLVFAGRLVADKGLRELCTAISNLDRVHLEVFGAGPLRQELEDRFRGTNITFSGYTNDIQAQFRNHDTFILPSHSEACPQSVLEAFGSGLSCLLSDIPAHRELTDGGRTAILFPRGDVAGMREAVIRLRDNPEHRFELAVTAQTWALQYYSKDAAKHKYLSVFDSICR